MSARRLPVESVAGGELVQSLTYREVYGPLTSPLRPGFTRHAPDALRSVAGGAWALVSLVAAVAVLLVLVLLVVRVVGVLA